jgi:hypothetical protein
MPKQYVSPTGSPAQGTLEPLTGVCFVDGINDDGTPSYLECGTKIFWDDQRTATREKKILYLDEKGAESTFDQLQPAEGNHA